MSTGSRTKKVFDGRYEILGIVGRGSQSVVYHAKNIVDGGPEVALKVLIADPKEHSATRDKLRKEALAMVSCHHRFVVRLDDFHSVGDLSYLSMEFAAKSDLRNYAKRSGNKLPEEQIEKFFLQAAKALDYIHSVGIIHRDIKPDNILVVSDEEIRLGDFGIALLPGDDQTPDEYRNAIGTMDYMAPEILDGRPCDSRTDLYALGVTMAEMLMGKTLFGEIPLANQLTAREDSARPELACSSLRLKEAIARCLSYESVDRFRNAKELIQTLTNAKENAPVTPPAPVEKTIDIVTAAPSVEITPAPEVTPPTPEPIKDKDEVPVSAPEPIRSPVAETVAIVRDDLVARAQIDTLAKEKVIEQLEDDIIEPAPSRLGSITKILLGLAVVLLGIKVLLSLFGGSNSSDTDESSSATTESVSDLRSASRDGVIDLSLLPTGAYSGTITGVHPTLSSTPLFVISDLDGGSVIVAVGLEGWKPTMLSSINADLRKIRLASGGIVLEISSMVTNDGNRIEGSVQNMTNGMTGKLTLKKSEGGTQ